MRTKLCAQLPSWASAASSASCTAVTFGCMVPILRHRVAPSPGGTSPGAGVPQHGGDQEVRGDRAAADEVDGEQPQVTGQRVPGPYIRQVVARTLRSCRTQGLLYWCSNYCSNAPG